MTFLQPLLLAALPLVTLPIIIHLINQRRYQTVRWAAMMFLLAANKMSRGYARLRQYLIMAARMAAIAGPIFAVSPPLTGRLRRPAGRGGALGRRLKGIRGGRAFPPARLPPAPPGQRGGRGAGRPPRQGEGRRRAARLADPGTRGGRRRQGVDPRPVRDRRRALGGG